MRARTHTVMIASWMGECEGNERERESARTWKKAAKHTALRLLVKIGYKIILLLLLCVFNKYAILDQTHSGHKPRNGRTVEDLHANKIIFLSCSVYLYQVFTT